MRPEGRQYVNWYRRFKRAQAKAAHERHLRRLYEAEARDSRHECDRLQREVQHLRAQVARMTGGDERSGF